MNLISHPVSFARLVDLAEGRLTADERTAVESHTNSCERCAVQLASLKKSISLMRADDSMDAPRDALAYAINLFGARRTASAPSLVERILAALTFDSALTAPAFGVRSSNTADSRQLMYAAGATDIDLRIVRSEVGWTISGQVLGECAGGRVEIAGGDSVELNELCEFALPPLSAGSYKLLLRLQGAEVEIPEIHLGA